MVDNLNQARRSENMRQIRSQNTKPELAVRKLLYSMGYRYRLHRRDLWGKPDIVFSTRRKVVFVHGCFWHGHADCVDGRIPKTRSDYWQMKIQKTQTRDSIAQGSLNEAGWSSLVVWECEIGDTATLQKRLRDFLDAE